MNRRKPEQIVKLLRKADEELAKGKAVEDFCREEQISAATYYLWQRKYGNLQVEDAKRLKMLEDENAKLKRLPAEAMLANDAIQEFLPKKSLTTEERHTGLEHVENKGLSQRAAYRRSGVSRTESRYKLRRPAQAVEYLKKMRTAAWQSSVALVLDAHGACGGSMASKLRHNAPENYVKRTNWKLERERLESQCRGRGSSSCAPAQNIGEAAYKTQYCKT